MKAKYKILYDQFIVIAGGTKVYRIKALKNFGKVKKGDIGGYVEKEENLSHTGNCWIDKNACVYGNAKVFDNACISDNARIFGSAWIYDTAHVSGNACVSGYMTITENSNQEA